MHGLIAAFGRALGAHGCNLLDVHSDADHNRSVFTLVGGPQELADSLLLGLDGAELASMLFPPRPLYPVFTDVLLH